MTLITATAAHILIVRSSGRTEYSVIDDNTGRKLAHVSVIRGFAHVTGSEYSAFDGLTAVIGLNGPDLGSVETAFIEGLRNGRDDRS